MKLPYRIIQFDASGNYAGYRQSPSRTEFEAHPHTFEVAEPPARPVLDGDGWREMTAAEIEAADQPTQREIELSDALQAWAGYCDAAGLDTPATGLAELQGALRGAVAAGAVDRDDAQSLGLELCGLAIEIGALGGNMKQLEV